ncbi:MAG: hypothetical protein HY037_06270, partial [Nitrospirae bacterium]|nr:hypothetical protein [Candidatus Troglogloeales bacterium]
MAEKTFGNKTRTIFLTLNATLLFLLTIGIGFAAGDSPPDATRNLLTIEAGSIDLSAQDRRFRENHFGGFWPDGGYFQASLQSLIPLGEKGTLTLEPVFNSDDNEIFLRRGFGHLVLSNTFLEVGRNSLWFGPGRHGALIMSNNGFPFDMVRLGSETPFLLPGFLARIGLLEAELFLTQLEENRKFPRPNLIGLRFQAHPSDRFTIGLYRVTLFGGDGRPSVTASDFLKILFGKPNQPGELEVNELAGVDLSFLTPLEKILPGHQLELYLEYAGEDEAGYLPSRGGTLYGLEWKDARRQFIIEYANNHVSGHPNFWYNHAIYPYTYRGNIIGHHMGSDAEDLYIRLVPFSYEEWGYGIDMDKENTLSDAPSGFGCLPKPCVKERWI